MQPPGKAFQSIRVRGMQRQPLAANALHVQVVERGEVPEPGEHDEVLRSTVRARDLVFLLAEQVAKMSAPYPGALEGEQCLQQVGIGDRIAGQARLQQRLLGQCGQLRDLGRAGVPVRLVADSYLVAFAATTTCLLPAKIQRRLHS
jgi:hypothetical protein